MALVIFHPLPALHALRPGTGRAPFGGRSGCAALPCVLGRFFRAAQSRTGAGNAGLGLAISQAIIEAQGGTMEVAGEENTGTIFTVRLPV